MVRRLRGLGVPVALMCCNPMLCSPAAAAQPWLFVNDVHYKPLSRDQRPLARGDTSPALLESSIGEMLRVAPRPPVVVMAGDFLQHALKDTTAAPTMVWLAHRFHRAFPHAQFVIALGNEDSACGDYDVAPDSAFLRVVARAWAPLVNYHNAAPNFMKTFVHDGFYTAKLPLAQPVRVVVVDDAFWSVRHQDCAGSSDPTPDSLDEMRRALTPTGHDRRWVIAHIPPGIDVSSTLWIAHRLAILPLLRPRPRDAFESLIADRSRRVELVVSGHIHRFAYRLIGAHGGGPPIPILISPAIDPLFGNAPAFLTADVAPDGTLRSAEEHAFVHQHWLDVGGTHSLGMREFSGSELVNVQRRLENDRDLRAVFGRLYRGASPALRDEISDRNWRAYWCAATALGVSAYRACVDVSGFGLLTGRGVKAVVIIASVLLLGLIGVAIFVRQRRTGALGGPPS